jgi:hypothetical protein
MRTGEKRREMRTGERRDEDRREAKRDEERGEMRVTLKLTYFSASTAIPFLTQQNTLTHTPFLPPTLSHITKQTHTHTHT